MQTITLILFKLTPLLLFLSLSAEGVELSVPSRNFEPPKKARPKKGTKPTLIPRQAKVEEPGEYRDVNGTYIYLRLPKYLLRIELKNPQALDALQAFANKLKSAEDVIISFRLKNKDQTLDSCLQQDSDVHYQLADAKRKGGSQSDCIYLGPLRLVYQFKEKPKARSKSRLLLFVNGNQVPNSNTELITKVLLKYFQQDQL